MFNNEIIKAKEGSCYLQIALLYRDVLACRFRYICQTTEILTRLYIIVRAEYSRNTALDARNPIRQYRI